MNIFDTSQWHSCKTPVGFASKMCSNRPHEIADKVGAGSTPLGGSKSYVTTGVKFLREQNVHDAGLVLGNVAFISSETHKGMFGSCVRAKDILINIKGASIGRNSLVPDDFDEANVNQHVLILRLTNLEFRHYLHLWLMSPMAYSQMLNQQKGDKPGLSAERVKGFLIPLPPLAEQKRIVAKVEALLTDVERLKHP